MLKYKILNNNNTTELVSIDYDSYKIGDNKDTITFNLSKSGTVRNNDTIVMNSTVVIDNIANNVTNNVNFELITEAIVTDDSEVMLNIPTTFQLTPDKVSLYEDNSSGVYVQYYILEFATPHFFASDAKNSDRIIYISNYIITNSNGEPIKNKIYFEYSSVNSIYIPTNISQISYTNDKGDNLTLQVDNKDFFDNYNTIFINEFKTFDYERDDFRFINPQILTISKRNSIFNIPLTIENNFEIDLFKEDLLTTNFVEKEKEKAINRIVNMEKQVYYPVYIKDDGSRDFIEKIVFNLHFRERSGDNWLVENDKFWNGTNYDTNPPSAPKCTSSTGNTTFSVPSNQSDLLYYLGFTNNDVRYQKNRLKKSFLRLLFYDSTNQTNQNLLYTSTIFMDSGTLFGKYCRYIEDEPYLHNKDGVIEESVGIKVDREPSCELLKKYDTTITNCCSEKADNVRDELRLSTQLVVEDKFNNQASSEGFYLYLFAEDDPKLVGKNIYMKVEFNHAGYGRTLPFMCPTNDVNGCPLSYQDIINEWYKYKNSDGEVVGFPVKKYYSYTYIKLECIYDKTLKRHVYYFANQCSSTGTEVKNVDEEDRKMIINLYEAKVG